MSLIAITGTFTATGQSGTFVPKISVNHDERDFNMSLWGTFVGTVQVERSFDAGANWLPLTALGNAIAFTAPCTEVFGEPEDSVIYRLNCTAYTSGTINYRLSR